MIATWRAEGGLGTVADYFAQGFDQMNDGECWGMGGFQHHSKQIGGDQWRHGSRSRGG